MVELSGEEKKFTVVKETVTKEIFEVLAESKEEAEELVKIGHTIGVPIWRKGSTTELKSIEVTENEN